MPIFQARVTVTKRINCPALLPKDPGSPLLTKMLFPAPYDVLEKKAKKMATGTRYDLWRKVVSDTTSEDTKSHSSSEDGEEEEEIHAPALPGEKEEEGHPAGEGQGVQEGENLPSGPLHRSHQQQRGVGAQGQAHG